MLLLFNSLFFGCINKTTSEEIVHNQDLDSNKEFKITNTETEEYYIFKDGYKLPKETWLKHANNNFVKYFFGDLDFGIKWSDCFMTKIAKKHDYSEVYFIIRNASNLNEKELINLFNKSGFINYGVDCQKEIGYLEKDLHIKFESYEIRKIFVTQVENEFNQIPEFNEIKSQINQNGFYNCITDSIIKNFTINQIISGEAYKSRQYTKICEQCLFKNSK